MIFDRLIVEMVNDDHCNWVECQTKSFNNNETWNHEEGKENLRYYYYIVVYNLMVVYVLLVVVHDNQ